MRTTQKGDYCIMLVLARLYKDDCAVALPFGNQEGWDLLLKENDVWKQVQIKTAYKRNGRGGIYIDCIRGGGRAHPDIKDRYYQCGEFDYLIGVSPETGEMWKIPSSDVIRRRCIAMVDDRYKW